MLIAATASDAYNIARPVGGQLGSHLGSVWVVGGIERKEIERKQKGNRKEIERKQKEKRKKIERKEKENRKKIERKQKERNRSNS